MARKKTLKKGFTLATRIDMAAALLADATLRDLNKRFLEEGMQALARVIGVKTVVLAQYILDVTRKSRPDDYAKLKGGLVP